MGEMLEQLEKYFEETPQEVQDQHFHEIMCDIYGIDPNHPDSKKMLKKKQRKEMWKYRILPHVCNVGAIFFMVWLFMHAGYAIAKDYPIWIIVIYILGGFGWFNIFIRRNYNRW